MITKVACTNPKCANYGKTKSVASAMLTGYNPKVRAIAVRRRKSLSRSTLAEKEDVLVPVARLAEAAVRE